MAHRVLAVGAGSATSRMVSSFAKDDARFVFVDADWESFVFAVSRHRPQLVVLDVTVAPPPAVMEWLAARKRLQAAIAVVDACDSAPELLELVDDFVIAGEGFEDE